MNIESVQYKTSLAIIKIDDGFKNFASFTELFI